MKSYRRKLVILLLSTLLFTILIDIPIAFYSCSLISETYARDIIMAEDVIFDTKEIVDLYGCPIILSEGMKGRTADSIDNHGDTMGYEYINAHFTLKDGTMISVAISINHRVEQTVKIYNDGILYIKPVFDIDKIDSSQKITNEYKLSRERYFKRVKNTILMIVLVSFIISILISLTMLSYILSYGKRYGMKDSFKDVEK